MQRRSDLDLLLQKLGEVLGLQQSILRDLGAVEDELEVHLGHFLLGDLLNSGHDGCEGGFA